MAAKKVWVTWMPKGEGADKPDQVLKMLDQYELTIGGTPLQDDQAEGRRFKPKR